MSNDNGNGKETYTPAEAIEVYEQSWETKVRELNELLTRKEAMEDMLFDLLSEIRQKRSDLDYIRGKHEVVAGLVTATNEEAADGVPQEGT